MPTLLRLVINTIVLQYYYIVGYKVNIDSHWLPLALLPPKKVGWLIDYITIGYLFANIATAEHKAVARRLHWLLRAAGIPAGASHYASYWLLALARDNTLLPRRYYWSRAPRRE